MNSKEIIAILENNYVAHLGCHADGETLVVPISYVYVNGVIYCHSKEGTKTGMMRKNPRVCFQVEEIKREDYWKSVICQCVFEEIETPAEKKEAVQHLLSRQIPYFKSETVMLSSTWPFHDDDTEQLSGVFFTLKIKSTSGRFEIFEKPEKNKMVG